MNLYEATIYACMLATATACVDATATFRECETSQDCYDLDHTDGHGHGGDTQDWDCEQGSCFLGVER